MLPHSSKRKYIGSFHRMSNRSKYDYVNILILTHKETCLVITDYQKVMCCNKDIICMMSLPHNCFIIQF